VINAQNYVCFYDLFIPGNHEYYTGDVDQWFAHLRNELGFTVLHNSHVNIYNQLGDFFCLAGTDDIEARRMQSVDVSFSIFL
jgi:hypothetical protein